MKTIKCYRFVKDDLTSENGEMSWKIGEWNKISEKIICCSKGLHASLTPRDSIRNVYGQRWFISEARGEIVKQDNKFAAGEMRIVQEIPKIILQRFSIWCATDCLKYYEKKYPNDMRVSDCIQAAEDYLDGKIEIDELIKKREVVSATIAAGANSGAAGRAAAAAIAANIAAVATNSAAWANAAAAAAYASHTAAAAYSAAIEAVDALYAAHNVASIAAAAVVADTAAVAAHTAASAGAVAHAAAVAAACNAAPVDTAADAYYSSFAAFSAFATDTYYITQNEKLLEMIDQNFAQGTSC